MSATIVSRPHNRLFALLAGGALLAVLPGPAAQKVQSPLAGTGPMAAQGSAELQVAGAYFERPDVAPVEGVVPGQIDFRSAGPALPLCGIRSGEPAAARGVVEAGSQS